MAIKLVVVLNLVALLLTIRHFNETVFTKSFIYFRKRFVTLKKAEIGSIEYYRLYKYMYLQSKIGMRVEDTISNLHNITEDKVLKSVLKEMAIVLSHSNDISRAAKYLRSAIKGEGSMLFINIIENSARTGLSADSMRRLDGMLFQKYVIDIKNRTKKIKRKYFWASFAFCSSIFLAIFLPMIDQMIRSLALIFSV